MVSYSLIQYSTGPYSQSKISQLATQLHLTLDIFRMLNIRLTCSHSNLCTSTFKLQLQCFQSGRPALVMADEGTACK